VKEHLEYAEKARTERRTAVVRAAFAAAFVGYLLTLWYHQVLEGESYRHQAANNIVRTQEVAAYRGNIRDRHGQILVKNRLSFNVLLNRELLRDTGLVVEFLAGVLDLAPETVLERLAAARPRPSHEPVVIEEDVSMAQAVSIEARRVEWPELSIAVTSRRAYPEGRRAAHVLGYVGEISETEMRSGRFHPDLRGGDIVGKTGIERVYELELQGFKGSKTVLVNSRGRVVEEFGVDSHPQHGEDVTLTLDAGLQRTLETALEGQVGAGIFLDPWTGEILAMTSAPAYEPDLFARRFPPQEWTAVLSDPLKPLQNRASLSRYSPGSTFKIVVAAAALEEGVVSPSTTIFCPGYAMIYGHRFGCHKEVGHGDMDLEEAIIHSCNVYFYNVGKALGIERIAEYAVRMGLGTETGIDLVSEDPGLIPTPEWKREARGEPWYAGETISVSIGQGPLGVTPLQMARLAAALSEPEPAGLSEATTRALRRAMTGVVNRGTGHRTRLPGIQVAAKTGTAQYSSRSAGIDADELPYAIRDHAWLVGYAPAERPRIAFAVFIEHGGHGGTTAAPVARQVLEHYFGLDDEPDPAVETARILAPGRDGEASGVAAP
jgi:penicillin-binding protein 2